MLCHFIFSTYRFCLTIVVSCTYLCVFRLYAFDQPRAKTWDSSNCWPWLRPLWWWWSRCHSRCSSASKWWPSSSEPSFFAWVDWGWFGSPLNWKALIYPFEFVRSGGARGPGVFFVLPCIDNYCKVDLRTVSFDVPPQEVLSKDSVTVSVDAVVYYRICDPLKAVIQVMLL